MKLAPIEKVERALLKLSKSLTSNLLTHRGRTREGLSLVSSKSLQAPALVAEETLPKDSIDLVDSSVTKLTDALRACRNEFLRKKTTKNSNDMQVLKK